MVNLMEKLGDLVFGSIGGIWKLLPEHFRKDAQARLQDHNPFAATSANEDLRRALRLAWIEVALKIDKAVVALPSTTEWRAELDSIQRFSGLVRTRLVAIRSQTFDRDTTLQSSPIDKHLHTVLTGVPKYVVNQDDDRGDDIGRSFCETLAEVLEWPANEVPEQYRHVALSGLYSGQGEPPRAFGELVFATFAEFVKHPASHPEIAAAFQIAQVEIARSVAIQTLRIARGLNEKFDALLTRMDGAPYKSLENFTAQAQLIGNGLAHLTVKVEALPTREQFAEILEQALSVSLKRELVDVARGMSGWLANSSREMLPADLLRHVTEIYGHPEVPVHELVPTLKRYAYAYRAIQQGIAGANAPQKYDSDTRGKLTELIAGGNIAAAEALMADTLARQEAMEIDLGRQRAATLSDRGRLAFLRDDLVGMCVFLRDARHAVRSDRRLAWTYALQTYALLCRDRRAEEAHEYGGSDLVGSAIGEDWESFSDSIDMPDSTWEWRGRIASGIDASAGMVIANKEPFQQFRSWSGRIEGTADALFNLAKQSRNLLEARASLAGFALYSASFYTSDDPIDIDMNSRQIDEARSLVREIERARSQ